MELKTIIFDCTHAVNKSTGIANYLHEYLDLLSDSFRIILAIPRGTICEEFYANYEIIWIDPIYPFYRNLMNRFVNFYRIRKDYPNALIFSPYYDQVLYGKKSLVVIHDLAFFDKRVPYPFKIRLFYYMILNLNAVFVSNIGVISRTLEKELRTDHRLFLFKRKNIVYLPNLVAPSGTEVFSPTDDCIKLNRFIYFGGKEDRKNIRLIQSLADYDVDPDLGLQISYTGAHWGSDIHAKFAKSSIKLLHLGYLDRSTLMREIIVSKAVLYPSISEGFGRPIQEAALLGIDTICLDLPVYREFFGDHPIYIDNTPSDLLDSMVAVAIGRIKPKAKPFKTNIDLIKVMRNMF